MKIIIRRQKKLILIYLLTIFLPSVMLCIFGIIAMRNEKFRIERQFREKQSQTARLFKSEINAKFDALANNLRHSVNTPVFINQDKIGIINLVENQIGKDNLYGQYLIKYTDKQPFFPPFRAGILPDTLNAILDYTAFQKSKQEMADRYEFLQNDYPGAISVLKGLLNSTIDKNQQGQILNRIARNLVKQNRFNEAAACYLEIISLNPENTSSSTNLLKISALLQYSECLLKTGQKEAALEESLKAFEEVIANSCYLDENQLSAYASMAREKFRSICKENPDLIGSDNTYTVDFENLDSLYRNTIKKWEIIGNLKGQCIPELSSEFIQINGFSDRVVRYTKKIGNEYYLLLSMLIPDETGTRPTGFAAIKINNGFLEDSLAKPLLDNYLETGDMSIALSDLNGRIIAGNPVGKTAGITSLFDGNFPPWRMEISGRSAIPLFTGLYKSFYFWTFLVMITILIFGILIIGRTIAHEKEMLKLKSDFVSSVSHEFKTPITSIRALTERLIEGSVKDPDRIKEYYSVIYQDAENLSRLVWNILDFAKNEEGKKQYFFDETDLTGWIEQIAREFFSKAPRRKYNFTYDTGISPILVKIDRDAMKLAVANLLDNAVKFSQGDSEVRVFLEKKGDNILLKIKDAGIGIAKREHSKIFEKFYRSENASRQSATGTGLGLTIVKQIVEDHGGEVLVESEPGKGSTFTVSIPVNRT